MTFTVTKQGVKPCTVYGEERGIILHRDLTLKAFLQPTIEIHQVWIHIVQERPSWFESKRDREASTERFHQTTLCVVCPEGTKLGYLPAFSTRPF